ncbi:DUF1972 domain-containing protein [Brevundimonas subvibrioides]|uniref:DUF1972 domain-containing protein n=1 Tax=Brevundimonas subvibrioides (strain ATCC 15264 / DSM 4735 / LMG 14903 / NBRC 16000 / CB 81) TaxID=633149 RepID=D9QP31_BRESC|nr:DUF1972 domain-containing protein [Brevundimonas subvibrioides]ADL00464.1 Protein of unknown function DUF1972 [Brevundimonas subvibrioides ATCC 15264]
MNGSRALYILGTRGIPAEHGGFETFAERLALHMVEKGWSVTVYCQSDRPASAPVIDDWRGVRRVTFGAGFDALGTMRFDFACVSHAMKERGVMLALGYNTAIFTAALRLTSNPLLTNMDGIEWKRAKWPWHGRLWLYLNEWIGSLTSDLLIADHPEIAVHLSRRRNARDIVMIPYGADEVVAEADDAVRGLRLVPGSYVISVGRVEPENNTLTMIRGFSRAKRNLKFVCVGKLNPQENDYHRAVLDAASPDVVFLGPVYDQNILRALRFHAIAYCHGHTVGGTNPSLVEALGAGNCVIAHENKYNRWVAGEDQLYFTDEDEFGGLIELIQSEPEGRANMSFRARDRFRNELTWGRVLGQYQDVLVRADTASGVN